MLRLLLPLVLVLAGCDVMLEAPKPYSLPEQNPPDNSVPSSDDVGGGSLDPVTVASPIACGALEVDGMWNVGAVPSLWAVACGATGPANTYLFRTPEVQRVSIIVEQSNEVQVVVTPTTAAPGRACLAVSSQSAVFVSDPELTYYVIAVATTFPPDEDYELEVRCQ